MGTYVVERLTGVIVYAVLLGIMFLFLKRSKSHRSFKTILNTYLVLLCVMAFFYIPGPNADLYRWREITRNWHLVPFDTFWDNYIEHTAHPAAYLMMYLCSFTQTDGVLPALCALIFFGNTFAILKDLHKRHGRSADSLAYTLFLFMATGVFLEVISGVRCMVSLSILARCFYKELYNKRSILWNVPFWIIASLIHSMAVILVLVRLAFILFQERRILRLVLNIVIAVVVAAVLSRYGGVYITAAFDKAEGYLQDSDAYSYVWEWVLGGILAAVLLAQLIRNYKYSHGLDGSRKILWFNALLMLIVVIFCTEYNTFHRMTTVSLLMSIPVVSMNLDLDAKVYKKQNLFLISILILALACVRGNLCGYKFFILE